eukprot:8648120-Pyramimonas_sp.AAC.1
MRRLWRLARWGVGPPAASQRAAHEGSLSAGAPLACSRSALREDDDAAELCTFIKEGAGSGRCARR